MGPSGVDVMLPWSKMASSHPWHVGGEAGCSGSAEPVLLGVFSPAGGSGRQKPKAEAAGPAGALLSRTLLAKAVTGQLDARAEEVDPALVRRRGRGFMGNFDPPSRLLLSSAGSSGQLLPCVRPGGSSGHLVVRCCLSPREAARLGVTQGWR